MLHNYLKMKKLLLIALSALSAFSVNAKEAPVVINVKTDAVSLILKTETDGRLTTLHFGGVIEDASALAGFKNGINSNHGSPYEAYPTLGWRAFDEPALSVTHKNGDLNTELRYVSHEAKALKDNNIEQTVIHLSDAKEGLDVDLVYTAYKKQNVITAHSVIRNGEKGAVTLHNYYSSALPVKADKYLLTHLHGAWAAESQMENTLLTHGTKSIESRKGVRTTHTENPAFMLSLDTDSFNENYGEVIAGALAWSGNYKLNFELTEFNVLNILAGINPYMSEYTLAKGESFTTPEMIWTWSGEGAGQASRNLHSWARSYWMVSGQDIVPTLLNSWEGAYFNFNAKTLTDMIDDAASMGLEMFVLDDGWFANKYPRKDDRAGLGDWEPTKGKLPEGIPGLVRDAKKAGVKFGIWIEPEMVNPKSELFEKHPDWAIMQPNREPYYHRHQLVLDISNPKVQDYVFGIVDRIMTENPDVAYFKWDCNSVVTNIFSPYHKANQGNFYIDHIRGIYSVLTRIHDKYPDLPMMLCSGGGGRMDYEMLKYFTEFWCSDDTDPYERIYIQWGLSKFFPAKTMSSHVTNWNRNTSVKFRTDVCSSCKLGFDIDLKSLSAEEYQFVKQAVSNYDLMKPVIFDGDLYRLVSPYEGNHCAINYVSKDQQRAVLFAFDLHPRYMEPLTNVRLQGLDPDRTYMVRETNLMPGKKSELACDGKQYSGDYLMKVGLSVFTPRTGNSHVLILE